MDYTSANSNEIWNRVTPPEVDVSEVDTQEDTSLKSQPDDAFSDYNRLKSVIDNYEKSKSDKKKNYGESLFEKILQMQMQERVTRTPVSETPKANSLSSLIDKMSENDPSLKEKKDTLLRIAKIESSFKQNVQSSSSTAYGWFQFIKKTRNSILKKLFEKTGEKFSDQDFKNNPEVQIKAASMLYDEILRMAKTNGSYRIAKSKGYTDGEIVAAGWLNPSWASDFFKSGDLANADANGTNIASYLNKFKA